MPPEADKPATNAGILNRDEHVAEFTEANMLPTEARA